MTPPAAQKNPPQIQKSQFFVPKNPIALNLIFTSSWSLRDPKTEIPREEQKHDQLMPCFLSTWAALVHLWGQVHEIRPPH